MTEKVCQFTISKSSFISYVNTYTYCIKYVQDPKYKKELEGRKTRFRNKNCILWKLWINRSSWIRKKGKRKIKDSRKFNNKIWNY